MDKVVNKLGGAALTLYILVFSFITYFSMYGLRKPFSATTYTNVDGWHFDIDLKVVLVVSQVFGYTISKFIGIKVITELNRQRRLQAITVLVTIALLALLLLPMLPVQYKFIALFINGLPLGMIWGIVISFVEGRKTSEFLGAALTVSFIVASGFVKSVGSYLIQDLAVSEFWMPFYTGLIFYPLLLSSAFMLSLSPPPTKEDEALRVHRDTMSGEMKLTFFKKWQLGLICLVIVQILLTALRDIRGNYEAEIWQELGFGNQPEIFATLGIKVGIFLAIILSCFSLVKNNRSAFIGYHWLIMAGCVLMVAVTLGFNLNLVDGQTWMLLLTIGLFTAYVPFSSVLFDRMVAATGSVGTATFGIYLCDAFGYLGSVILTLVKYLSDITLSWVDFLQLMVVILSVSSVVMMLISAVFFARKLPYIASEPVRQSQPLISNQIKPLADKTI